MYTYLCSQFMHAFHPDCIKIPLIICQCQTGQIVYFAHPRVQSRNRKVNWMNLVVIVTLRYANPPIMLQYSRDPASGTNGRPHFIRPYRSLKFPSSSLFLFISSQLIFPQSTIIFGHELVFLY